MAKKKATKKPGTDAAAKREWLAAKRKKFSKASDAVAALQKKFGSALAYPEIANILKGKPARAGFGSTSPKKKRKKKAAKKRAARKAPARTKARKRVGRTAAPGWVVAVPGRGRSWSMTACGTQAEAAEVANDALGRGVKPAKLAVYERVDVSVKSTPTISL